MNDRLPLILLMCLAALFGATLAAELVAEPAPEAEIAASASRPGASQPATRSEPAAEVDQMIATILGRPLFNANRRPAASTDSPVVASSLDDTRLAGIVIESGRRFAVFAPNGAKAMLVKEGDTVNGWRIDSITPREVSLSGPTGNRTLQPKNDPHLAAPAPPLPLPPRAGLPGGPPIVPPVFNQGPGRPMPMREPR